MSGTADHATQTVQIIRRRPRRVRFALNPHARRRPLTAVYTNSAATVEIQAEDDDFLMRTMLFEDDEPWVTYAAELQEALEGRREAAGRIRRLRRFSALVIELALRKSRAYARKLLMTAHLQT